MAPRKREATKPEVKEAQQKSTNDVWLIYERETREQNAKIDKARMAIDLLKTLVVAHAARTGAGLNRDSLLDHARLAKLAAEEVCS